MLVQKSPSNTIWHIKNIRLNCLLILIHFKRMSCKNKIQVCYFDHTCFSFITSVVVIIYHHFYIMMPLSMIEIEQRTSLVLPLATLLKWYHCSWNKQRKVEKRDKTQNYWVRTEHLRNSNMMSHLYFYLCPSSSIIIVLLFTKHYLLFTKLILQ